MIFLICVNPLVTSHCPPNKVKMFQHSSGPWSLLIILISHVHQPPFYVPVTLTFFSYKKWPCSCFSEDIFTYYCPCPGHSSHLSLDFSLSCLRDHFLTLHDQVKLTLWLTVNCIVHFLCCSIFHTILTFPDLFMSSPIFETLHFRRGIESYS